MKKVRSWPCQWRGVFPGPATDRSGAFAHNKGQSYRCPYLHDHALPRRVRPDRTSKQMATPHSPHARAKSPASKDRSCTPEIAVVLVVLEDLAADLLFRFVQAARALGARPRTPPRPAITPPPKVPTTFARCDSPHKKAAESMPSSTSPSLPPRADLLRSLSSRSAGSCKS